MSTRGNISAFSTKQANMKYGTLLCFILLITACSQEVEYQIDSAFDIYVSNFEYEASIRERNLDVASLEISIYFSDIPNSHVLGQCLSFSDASHEVVIDSLEWFTLDELEKEYLIFHELGHCVLGRGHDDSSDNQGRCISLMQSGEGACQKRYNDTNRTTILDELFR